MSMNGAQSLIASLVRSDVNVCFSNPGTVRNALCSSAGACRCEQVFARSKVLLRVLLTDMPGWLKNRLRRCFTLAREWVTPSQTCITPRKLLRLVNIVGEHATHHRKYEAPLTSNIEGYAEPFSKWLRVSQTAMLADAADAIAASQSDVPGIATLLLPANTAWDPGGVVADKVPVAAPKAVDPDVIVTLHDDLRRLKKRSC